MLPSPLMSHVGEVWEGGKLVVITFTDCFGMRSVTEPTAHADVANRRMIGRSRAVCAEQL